MRYAFLYSSLALLLFVGCKNGDGGGPPDEEDASINDDGSLPTPDASLEDAAAPNDASLGGDAMLSMADAALGSDDASLGGEDASLGDAALCVERWGSSTRVGGMIGYFMGPPSGFQLSASGIAAGDENVETDPVASIVGGFALDGDFDVTANFVNFMETGEGTFFRARVRGLSLSSDSAWADIHVGSGGRELRVDGNDGSTTEMTTSTSGSMGSFRIKRTGTMITLTATVGGDMVSQVIDYGSDSLFYNLELGNEGMTPVAGASVVITNVEVMDGVDDDFVEDFSCDSVLGT